MKSNIKNSYRKFLISGIFFGLLTLLLLPVYYSDQMVPDKIYMHQDSEYSFPISLPFTGTLEQKSQEVLLADESNIPANQIAVTDSTGLSINDTANYTYTVKLFGLIPMKKSEVTVVEDWKVAPCGASVGLYLKSEGLLVVGTTAITDVQELQVEPAKDILQSGDYILSCNGINLEKKEEFVQMLTQCDGKELILSILRNGEVSEVKLQPVQTKDGYKLGIWIRDDVQGIGTITYIKEDGSFGALGHPISDSDTGDVLYSTSGSVYRSSIQAIIKGRNGTPGSLSGMILYGSDNYYGTIEKNCEAGVYGRLKEEYCSSLDLEMLPIAFSQDVKEGKAYIRSNVSGEFELYEIEITGTRNNNGTVNKQISFQVTDERLLELTGGIVQGMSGSPLIQNGKLIGAVTHVLVNDPTRGYGIFIENMLETANTIAEEQQTK